MEKTDRYILGRIYWKAKQYSIPSASSHYYEQLDAVTQKKLSSCLQEDSGIPALFFAGPGAMWTLLCTRQVIGYNGQGYANIGLSGIQRLCPHLLDMMRDKDVPANGKDKTTWTELSVLDIHNAKHILHTANGTDLFALWNILLMGVRMERQQNCH